MSYRFYRDEDGDPRTETSRDLRLLGRFLEADVQGSIGICAELLATLADIAAGRSKRRQLTGNAHTLILSKRRARIRAESGRSRDLVLSPEVLRQALLEWKTFLQNAAPMVRRSRVT
jgi:uncharacterized protein YacL (UPF0231 family)